MPHDVIRQVIPNFIRTPHRSSKQMLHGKGSFVPSLFGKLPAILSLYWAHESAQISEGPLSRLSARETFTDQFCNFFQFIGPSLRQFDSDFSVSLFRFHHDLHSV